MANPIGSLADPFNQTSLNTAMWSQSVGGTTTMSYATTGVSVVLPSTASAADIGQLSSVSTYDLTGSSISIHVITAPAAATHVDAYLQLYADGSNFIRWIYEAGTLYAYVKVATVDTFAATLTYSSSTHAYWRISESGGVLTWWTSTNGATWTSRATFTHNMASITAMTFHITAACFQAETSAGSFKWNQLNGRLLAPKPYTKQQAVNRSYTY